MVGGAIIMWTNTNNGCYAEVANLGKVEIYMSAGGFAVDINGKRAWSACKGNLRSVQLDIAHILNQWAYINQFRE
jgi:hypothetical protein